MEHKIITLIGVLIPFLGTTLGSCLVLFCKKQVKSSIQKVFLGFAAGVMIAASIWSLIIPSMELAEDRKIPSWIPATIGIILGVFFLFIVENSIDRLKKKNITPNLKNNMLEFAIILHNIPEGMAVGVVFASALNLGNMDAYFSALSVAIGIAIQNIPEGMAISLPARSKGVKRLKSFWYGVLSGIVEPVFAIITILISDIISVFLPVLLAFAAGSMLYVVIKELIPESQETKYSNMRINRNNKWIFNNDDFRCYIRLG